MLRASGLRLRGCSSFRSCQLLDEKSRRRITCHRESCSRLVPSLLGCAWPLKQTATPRAQTLLSCALRSGQHWSLFFSLQRTTLRTCLFDQVECLDSAVGPPAERPGFVNALKQARQREPSVGGDEALAQNVHHAVIERHDLGSLCDGHVSNGLSCLLLGLPYEGLGGDRPQRGFSRRADLEQRDSCRPNVGGKRHTHLAREVAPW